MILAALCNWLLMYLWTEGVTAAFLRTDTNDQAGRKFLGKGERKWTMLRAGFVLTNPFHKM